MKKTILLIHLFLFCFAVSNAQESVLLKVAKSELQRTMDELKNQQYPPYFISYLITDVGITKISASFGKIETSSQTQNRIMDLDLRVGSFQFDNSHIIRGNPFNFSSERISSELPLENNEKAIRSAIWWATDQNYKKAIEKYEKALTNKAVKVQEEDSSADFTKQMPKKYIENAVDLKINIPAFEDKVRRLSALFTKYNWIYSGDVVFQAEKNQKYFVSTEGSELQFPENYFRIYVIAKTKADDGMALSLTKSYFSYTPDGLPSYEKIEKDIMEMLKTLGELRTAPLMTTYSGPAILSGDAAGVFFHEIFGHRVEGHRQKDPNSSQTFKSFIGDKILPDFLNVIFDPTIKERNGTEIAGYYKYDDEGVEAKKVTTVDKGYFRDFLMSRTAIDGFPASNGHGRKQVGYRPVSRQSNLMVLSDKTVTVADLKQELREEAKRQGKEYGLYFKDVQGGFTFTGRVIPNAFNVNPLIVYKVYVDEERPDELVRGVDLIGTPLTTFSKIIGSADDVGIFNGICGAESGSVPVSASSPSLLIQQIEVQKKQKSQAKPPILAAP